MDNTGCYTMTINLQNTEGIKRFYPIAMTMESDIDLAIDRYTVDAKSILGILSLNVSKNLSLRMYEKVKGEFATMKLLMRDYGFLVE